MKKTRVIILFGGRSAEHEISILSARNVVAALDRDRFEPVLVGIDRAGRWHQESERTLAGATGDPRALALDPAAPTVSIEQGLVGGAPPRQAGWPQADDRPEQYDQRSGDRADDLGRCRRQPLGAVQRTDPAAPDGRHRDHHRRDGRG